METENAQQKVNPEGNLSQDTLPSNPISNQRGNFLLIIGIVVLLLVIGAGGYFLYQKQVNKPVATQVSYPTPSPTSDETANWKTYTNSELGYSLKYPPQFEIYARKQTSPTLGYELFFTNNGTTVKPNENGVLVGVYTQEIATSIETSSAKTIKQYIEQQDIQITLLSNTHGSNEAATVSGPGGSSTIYRFGDTFFSIAVGYYDGVLPSPNNGEPLDTRAILDTIQFNSLLKDKATGASTTK